MTLKQRINKLENKLGIKKMFVFELPDGMDSDAIENQFCRGKGINPNQVNLFIFIRRFGNKNQDWKILNEYQLKS